MEIVIWIFEELAWVAIPFVFFMLYMHFSKKRSSQDRSPSNSNSEYYSSGIDPDCK